MPGCAQDNFTEAEKVPKSLPSHLDCETLTLLRSFLAPILQTAATWPELARQLSGKGYEIAFREGHLVLLKGETGEPVCTGRALGVPLREISARIGRPSIRAHTSGHSGDLSGLRC